MLKQKLIVAVLAVALGACGTSPRRSEYDIKPAASGPKAAPQRNVTYFADGLRCMDDMLFRYGVRDVSVMIEEMQDNSRRLGAGTRDMMVSAFSDMTRRSRGLRLVTFGQDNQNIVQLLSIAQRLNDFKVVPQFDIRGSITQFDEDVERKQAGVGASLVSAVTGPLFGVRFNSTKQSSVLGFDASVVSTSDLALVPGASSKNIVVVTKEEKGASDGLAQIRNGSLSFAFTVGRSEGVAQSLRNMIELATIELTGKLLRLPYWSCLNLDSANPEVQREMEDWFFAMRGKAEATMFFQDQLRNRRFYDGPVDGKPNTAYTAALAAYRRAIGLKGDSDPDLEVFTAFLLRPIPKAPAQPFTAEKAADGSAAAQAGTAAATKTEIKLAVNLAKTRYKKGEPIELSVTAAQPAYLYCFVQSPATGKIQRIFPNRFVRDPRVEANVPLLLPGAQGFKVLAGGDGVRQQGVGCLATEREIYNELSPQLRWGDFEDIRLGTFEEIRAAFIEAAKGPVALEGALIDVTDR
jgi:curli biogenesis system outer membrane secretion channel CsgG